MLIIGFMLHKGGRKLGDLFGTIFEVMGAFSTFIFFMFFN